MFYEVLEWFYEKYGSLVESFQSTLLDGRAELYVKSIGDDGAHLDECSVSIDGMNICIARLNEADQRATYNGHKPRNAIKRKEIGIPEGLIFHLYGHEEGRRNYMTLFHHSGVEKKLSQHIFYGGVQ